MSYIDVESLRRYAVAVMRRGIPPDASAEEVLAVLQEYLRWVEEAWLDAKAKLFEQESLAARQRQAASAGQPITGKPDIELLVTQLIGAGFRFSQAEDYRLALEWAVRAYCQGLESGQMDRSPSDDIRDLLLHPGPATKDTPTDCD